MHFRNVLDSYREKAVKVFSTLMDEVRRNTIYSVFIYQPKNQNTNNSSNNSNSNSLI